MSFNCSQRQPFMPSYLTREGGKSYRFRHQLTNPKGTASKEGRSVVALNLHWLWFVLSGPGHVPFNDRCSDVNFNYCLKACHQLEKPSHYVPLLFMLKVTSTSPPYSYSYPYQPNQPEDAPNLTSELATVIFH